MTSKANKKELLEEILSNVTQGGRSEAWIERRISEFRSNGISAQWLEGAFHARLSERDAARLMEILEPAVSSPDSDHTESSINAEKRELLEEILENVNSGGRSRAWIRQRIAELLMEGASPQWLEGAFYARLPERKAARLAKHLDHLDASRASAVFARRRALALKLLLLFVIGAFASWFVQDFWHPQDVEDPALHALGGGAVFFLIGVIVAGIAAGVNWLITREWPAWFVHAVAGGMFVPVYFAFQSADFHKNAYEACLESARHKSEDGLGSILAKMLECDERYR